MIFGRFWLTFLVGYGCGDVYKEVLKGCESKGGGLEVRKSEKNKLKKRCFCALCFKNLKKMVVPWIIS